jgi:Asp-tRNA(Asn)/Glu-tRNA(Gln) amidotransferase A subunit family amidase
MCPCGRHHVIEDALAFQPAWQITERIRSGDLSPVEATEYFLGRIAKLDGTLNAFITVAGDQALEAARTAEKRLTEGGDDLPPLLGVPIALKDLEMTAGIRSTMGSPALRDHVPEVDSVVAERVRASGAIIIGKTSTPELGMSFNTTTDNPISGVCHNPWDLTKTTAGSSGGSAAAVVSGMLPFATGSDGGGSMRIPASFCGVYGIKPSHGRVPRANGYGEPEPNQFAQSGPMTRDVRDAALLLSILSGPHPADPNSLRHRAGIDLATEREPDLNGIRIGWSPDFSYGVVDSDVADTVLMALQKLRAFGAVVEEVDLPLEAELIDHFWTIFSANAFAAFGHLKDQTPVELGPDGREAMRLGAEVKGSDYAKSVRRVADLKLKMSAVMRRYDFIASPTTSITAFDPNNRPKEVGGKKFDGVYGYFPFTYIFNMTGQPAASVPAGLTGGLPVGLQIAGKFGDDLGVLWLSAALEKVSPWAGIRPVVS